MLGIVSAMAVFGMLGVRIAHATSLNVRPIICDGINDEVVSVVGALPEEAAKQSLPLGGGRLIVQRCVEPPTHRGCTVRSRFRTARFDSRLSFERLRSARGVRVPTDSSELH